jgi:ABC-type lipoprotein export system ATPase subunit
MLSFKSVTKNYQLDGNTTITPVHDVDLDVQQGEFTIIVGRSGTGKTTLLNLAAGMVKPTSGQVKVNNVDLAAMNQKQLSDLRAQKIGFIFQFPSLIPALNIKDNVTLPALFNKGKNDASAEKKAAELLDMLGLSSKMPSYPRHLSAGETKRVVLARALVNDPQLILADEPTSDLDTKTEIEVMNILRDINARGVTFMMVTHSLQLIPFATRAYEMQDGKLTEIRTRVKV